MCDGRFSKNSFQAGPDDMKAVHVEQEDLKWREVRKE